MPDSIASAKCSRASSLPTCQPLVMGDHAGISPPPYVMQPKARRETVIPVDPSLTYSIFLFSGGADDGGATRSGEHSHQIAVTPGRFAAEARLEVQLCAPIHAACSGF